MSKLLEFILDLEYFTLDLFFSEEIVPEIILMLILSTVFML